MILQPAKRASEASLRAVAVAARVGRNQFSTSSAISESLVTVEKVVDHESQSQGVYKVVLNAPDKMNALTVAMGDEFVAHIDELASRPDLRAVVLTGAGRAFSAGGDLAWLQKRVEHPSGAANAQIMKSFYRRFLGPIRQLPVPCVAAINGHAVGAGACVSLACDLRVMSRTAKFGLNFVQLGLTPGMGGTHFLPRVVGDQAAALMLLTGDLLDAAQAREFGLVLRVADSGADTVADALDIAARISRASPAAVRHVTRTLRSRQDVGLDQSLLLEATGQGVAYHEADIAEGLLAVRSKRAPVFPDFGGPPAQ